VKIIGKWAAAANFGFFELVGGFCLLYVSEFF